MHVLYNKVDEWLVPGTGSRYGAKTLRHRLNIDPTLSRRSDI